MFSFTCLRSLFSTQQTQEKKPRESILRAEFANAIDYINKDLSEENRLRFLHWDLNKHTRRYMCDCGIFIFPLNFLVDILKSLFLFQVVWFLFVASQQSNRCSVTSGQSGCICFDTDRLLLLSNNTSLDD